MVINNVRFSYCNVFEARPTPSGELKFSVSVLIPKKDEATVKKVKDEIQNAITKGLESGNFTKAQAASPTFKLPLRDGDAEFKAGARGKEYEGMYFFNASSKNRPGVVGPDAQTELMDSEEFYSGVWGHIDVNFYPFPVKGSNIPSRGIAAGLNNLMKVRDDDRLDGRQRAQDAFSGMAEPEVEAQEGDIPWKDDDLT